MVWLAAGGGGAFVLVSLILGPRLLALSRRTRQLPELTVGLCVLLMGGLGYPLAAAGRAVAAAPDELRGLAIGGAALCNTIGFAALGIFNWRVFRPASLVAEAAVAVVVTTLLVLLPAEAIWPGLVESALSPEPYPGLPGYLRVLVGLAVLCWASVEAGVFSVKIRRQLALGLADPVVADRVRLWTIAMSCGAISMGTSFALSFRGIDLAASPLGAAIVGTLGLASAISMWLAFLPPVAYTAWVRTRA